MASYFAAPAPAPSYLDQAYDSVSAAATDAQFQATGALGMREKTNSEQLREHYDAACPSLSYQTRFIGYCVFMGLGFACACVASMYLGELLKGDPTSFAARE